VLTLTKPANGGFVNSTSPTLGGLAGTAAGDSSTVTVKVFSGRSVTATPLETLTATRQLDGSWSVPASPALAQGTYTAQAQQADAAGNVGYSSASTFTVDTTAPLVTLTSPTNGSSTSNTSPTIQGGAGTATGDSSAITVRVYSGPNASGTPVRTLSTTASSGRWSVAVTPALTKGSYTVQAQQSDAAGNVGKSKATTFRLTRG
jgi:hypothetical protein